MLFKSRSSSKLVNDDATDPETLQPSSQPKNSIDDEQEASIHRSLLNMLE
jgi:hypothetical protein